MDLTILKKIGLTDGEISVYGALIDLGKAPIFKLMKKSKVSSSKVYLILDKLIQKGLVSFCVEDGTKNFQPTNPASVLDYANQKEEELNNFSKDFKNLIPQINKRKGSFEQESAQVYTGVKGIGAAFQNLLKEIKKGEEYFFFSITPDEMTSKNMNLFFKNYHLKRIERGVRIRGIVHPLLKSQFIRDILYKKYSVKRYKLTLPTGAVIGRNRVLIPFWGEQDICYEIISKRVVERYRVFFEKIWKIAK